MQIILQRYSCTVLTFNMRLDDEIKIVSQNQAPGCSRCFVSLATIYWGGSGDVFTRTRLSYSWRTVCGLERYGNTARAPLVAVGHMTLVFRWPRRTVFKIISFLSLCFTLFYNWPSSSPTLRREPTTDEFTLVHRQEPSLPPLQGRLPLQQLVLPFGSKLWNLRCSGRVFFWR